MKGYGDYRYTPPSLGDSLHPRRQEISTWAEQWTTVIGELAGGLGVRERQRIFLAVHEIRKRVLAADYGPPGTKHRPKQLSLYEPEPAAESEPSE